MQKTKNFLLKVKVLAFSFFASVMASAP
ncbi:conjugal transfer protein TraC, partial [Salmonella enterica subsp. enterica serovar Typhimurium]|nr:conjugal transfer protein TraC [Salmonella enterica subsp. enterica serovar Typhimurium]